MVGQQMRLNEANANANANGNGNARRKGALKPSIVSLPTRSLREEVSSGFFDINAVVTAVDPNRPQWGEPSPSPSLILPIVEGPRSSSRRPSQEASRQSVTSPFAVPSNAMPSLDYGAPSISHFTVGRAAARTARRSDALALLGFGLAWIATTGSAAIVVSRWTAPPAPRSVPAPTCQVAAPVASMPAFCPAAGYEPPLVSVKDLPVVAPAPARFAWGGPVRHTVVHAAAPPTPYRAFRSDRRADLAPAAGHGSRAAKSAPQSLEDWIRGSVTGEAANRP